MSDGGKSDESTVPDCFHIYLPERAPDGSWVLHCAYCQVYLGRWASEQQR